ncbi:hypothetical protein [Flavobacterium cerinum]|uniref:Uncharacterized protein n=1 Tax=Flavobacterium cerinum TaxID=2502784 RepID=A0A444HEP0_9FLAO|nr:hypothetical protein [Flavobacterium cerinum]RWX03458.1 hypothetical protein EPI11_00575 [Flavobacterium cerinum]
MKTHLLFKAAIVALILSACSSEENLTKTDDSGRNAKVNESQLAVLQREANAKLTQHFTFNTNQGPVVLKTKSGVQIRFNPKKFTVRGIPVQGQVKVEYKEIFKAGNMVTANKTTMGIAQDVPQNPDDIQLRPLLTGGEFFINMTNQEGQNLDNGNPIVLTVPTALTDDNGGNTGGMTVWDGKVADTDGDGVPNPEGNVTWKEKQGPEGNPDLVPAQGGSYTLGVTQFGWTNIDVLYNLPDPKTTVYIEVPPAYNNTNSSCYIAYYNVSNSIAPMDRFDPTTNMFTEHYGQLPIGMSCYAIFVSAQGGVWEYAIKPVVISPSGIITITTADILTGTEATVIAAIDALP